MFKNLLIMLIGAGCFNFGSSISAAYQCQEKWGVESCSEIWLPTETVIMIEEEF